MQSSNSEATRQVGESAEWEASYVMTRRSLWLRRRRLRFFNSLQTNARILDLGAGDGLDMVALGAMTRRRVVGLDASPALLAHARGDRVVGDAHRLPFADRSFRVVLANSILHHLDFPRLAPELARVLEPEGTLCFMEPRPCLARRILDRLTFSRLAGALLSYFRHRRAALLEEYEVHYRWLGEFAQVPDVLAASGFVLERRKLTLIGVLAEWRKRAMP